MVKALSIAALLAALTFVSAAPAGAELYDIRLHNGGRIQSRQAPIAVDYLPDRLLVLTEVGNWVGLATDDIASIEAMTESRGFGTVIDTTTISLGVAPNDRIEAQELDPQERLLQMLEQRSRPRENYSVEQFAEPSEAGGIPIWMTGVTTPPLGGVAAPMPMSGAEPNQPQ
jgi:hypothetical protein